MFIIICPLHIIFIIISPLWAGCSHQSRHTFYDHTSSYHLSRVMGHKGQVKVSGKSTLTQFRIRYFLIIDLFFSERLLKALLEHVMVRYFHHIPGNAVPGWDTSHYPKSYDLAVELGSCSQNCLSNKCHKNVETIAMYLSDSISNY